MALLGFQTGGADVGCSTTSGAEGSVIVVADNTFANDFAITIPKLLVFSLPLRRRECGEKESYGASSALMFPAPEWHCQMKSSSIEQEAYLRGRG